MNTDNEADRLLFEAPAQGCTSPDGRDVRLEGCFRLVRQADGRVVGRLYGDLDAYPFLAPDGIAHTLQLLHPPEVLEGHAISASHILGLRIYLRFPRAGDAHKLAQIWADHL